MPKLHEVCYLRNATIAAIRDYYTFLSRLYLDEARVIIPPEAGWPEITSADTEELGKTDEVVALLAHLPYICADGDQNDKAHGAPDCFFADWRFLIRSLVQGGTNADELKVITEGAEFYEDAPPDVIGLTAGADNPLFVLDTKHGIIHWYECPGEIRDNAPYEPIEDDPYDWAPENEADWRNDAPAWGVTDFFDLLKEQFCELKFIPINQHTVISVYMPRQSRSEGMIPMLQSIYREHGWPSLEHYRKQECLAAVQQALEERYPHEADFRRGQ
ncbi:hypothetical protein F4820DRAFT_226807 [Hypoxylon rubiginosum]|uniref:Uncharacterized protein n=1 Tax=Hypoxylon rubiginosum TaxID=110542 RepID=A0ACB9YHC4_9PEZI|nr:hypothetical protein F4820DRAFT_226807 [Hypoxylon rubiginosum]